MTSPVYVEGVALRIGWADSSQSLGEMIFGAVRAALDDGGQRIADVDSVVIAAHDIVDGRSLSSMITGPAAGGYLRDEVRVADDGAVALSLASARIAAGEASRSVVAAWGRASEGVPDLIANVMFDPFFERPLGLTELAVSALRAQQWLGHHEPADAARIAAARRRAEQAEQNPRALRHGGARSAAPYPLTEPELPLWADVAVALIVSDQPSAVRVAGVGHGSEPYAVGDRSLDGLAGLAGAVDEALGAAGVTAGEIDLFEFDGLTLFDEAIAAEAAGRARPGDGVQALVSDPAVNPSGGSAGGYCAPAMGLARIAEAVLQLQGRAGPVQQGPCRRALATGSSTVAGQTHTAVVLEAQ